MVKVKEQTHLLSDGSIDVEAWLNHLTDKLDDDDLRLIRNACILSQLAGEDIPTETGQSCLQEGLGMAEILADLDLDQTTIAAAIIYSPVQHADLNTEDIQEQLGPEVAKLVAGVERMDAISLMRRTHHDYSRAQIDNLRKMLIAMVDDVRVVLIKLAERLHMLRSVAKLSETIKHRAANEAMNIYAPLANRLGIGQLKWELEDLAFRYLQPQQYKEIASGLKSRRLDRDQYVQKIVNLLESKLDDAGLKNYNVYGRAKHIHSIHRKMQRKNIDIAKIYDATAVRVLVDNVEDCYTALGIAHSLWKNIPEEFDDYITTPKPNGYRSLHTAVIGPEDRNFEVQIRTHQMHAEAELGVAAHWLYKEGGASKKAGHERKIDWLRELLDWQKELANPSDQKITPLTTEFLDERIYVFTPAGDIIDLAKGSTPLDFAYHIHSEVGHRCRGAKIDNHIVPLTHALKTGDQVEVLTTKHPQPSRDWLNPHLGYLKSSRAKAKVLHWFKQQNYDQHRQEGLEMLEREIRKLDLPKIDYEAYAKKFNYKKADDMFAALGRGDLRFNHFINVIQQQITPAPDRRERPVIREEMKRLPNTGMHVEGVGNLLTYIAKCCKPVPGDPIIGFISRGRGIAIHRQDCANISYANQTLQERLIKVNWGDKASETFSVDINVTAYDRHNLLRDITSVLANEKINVTALNTKTDKEEHIAYIELTVELHDLQALSRLLDKINQLPNIVSVKRVTQ